MLERFHRIISFIACYLLHTNGLSYPEYGMIETCTGTPGSNEILFMFDTEVAAYMDLEEAKLVLTIPEPIYSLPEFFALHMHYIDPDGVGLNPVCKESYDKTFTLNASEALASPWTSVFPKNEVNLHVNNTLICVVSGFFPPPVRVSWTKNNVNVTDEAVFSRYYPQEDRNLNVFSRLSFIPEEGDIYSCSVEHKTLQQPQTRTWGVVIQKPSIGPSVLCGVGLALGLLGLATGVFFIAKGKKWI